MTGYLRLTRLSLLLSLAVLTLLLTSCSGSDPMNTLASQGIVAQKQQDLFWLIFRWAAAVFIVVQTVLLFAVFRFRRKSGDPDPVQTHGNTRLEIAWTIAPTLILLSVAVPTIGVIWDNATPPPVTLDVKVVGHQWWWEFQYPGFGVVTANELHIPQGEAINLALESADVIHSFWVPKLAGKTDVVPSRTNRMWLRGDRSGTYYAQCAELCGIQHAQMRFRVVVQPRDQFDAWVTTQRTPPPDPKNLSGLAAQGAQIFANPRNGCIACHTVQGVSAGVKGPNLSHVGGRQTIAAGALDNTPENLSEWIRDPDAIKKGNLMAPTLRELGVHLKDEEVWAVAAYLSSLK